MKKSTIIKELANGQLKLEDALYNLLVIALDLKNDEIIQWVKSELNGYRNSDGLPDYRKNLPYTILYSGIIGRYKITNQPLSILDFGEYQNKISDLNSITNSIIELISSDNGKHFVDLTPFSGIIYNNTGKQCVNIRMEFSEGIKHIISVNLKTKLLETFILLEEEFGSLDELSLDVKSLEAERIMEINKKLTKVLIDGKEVIYELQ